MRLKTPQWSQPTGAAAEDILDRAGRVLRRNHPEWATEIEPAGYAVAEPRA